MHTYLFIHSFILETYIAPLQDTTTQRRSQPSHGQRRRYIYAGHALSYNNTSPSCIRRLNCNNLLLLMCDMYTHLSDTLYSTF